MVTPATPTGGTFPIPWDEVASPVTLTMDRMHFPHPLTPLTLSAHAAAFAWGQSRAWREYGSTLGQRIVRDINHYRFEGLVPYPPGVDAGPDAAESQRRMQEGMAGMLARWHGEHLPALERLYARLRQVDPAGASVGRRRAMLDELEILHREMWLVHFRIAVPMLAGAFLFTGFYKDLFDGDDADAYRLLTGTHSKSTAAGIAMADLATIAREAGLGATMTSEHAEDVLPRLRREAAAQPFLDAFEEFLDQFGLRQDMFDLASPTWREEPSIPLATIATYVASGHDARAEQERAATQADQAAEEARRRLGMYPAQVRERFEAMLLHARHASFLQEEHNFYIDQMGLSLLRLAYLRFADALVTEGVLPHRDDVFMLTTGELRQAVTGELAEIPELVRQRREEMAIARTLTPPPYLGPAPVVPPGEPSLAMQAMQQFFGGPPRQSGERGVLLGFAGSRGKARGRARVVQSLTEANDLRPGEILVAPTTMPAWTPLFGIAAGVVTETGGSLSHCAIVAREYGIPAVVGVAGATMRITTGQEIEVNGTKGRVRLMDEIEPHGSEDQRVARRDQ